MKGLPAAAIKPTISMPELTVARLHPNSSASGWRNNPVE